MDFKELPLHPDLLRGIEDAGYITCTPVQEQVLTGALDGTDLYVQSQTGTGKTAAYLITIFQRLASDASLAGKKALVMVPTRELAVQVEEEARTLGKYLPFVSASFYGGVGYARQQELLKSGTDLIIGTPGRVIDLQQSGTMDLSSVAFLVVDEADRMFDMGFYPDLRTLLKVLPTAEQRQTMLFSATLNTWVKNLAWEYTVEAKEITIESDQVTVDEIDQMLFHVSSDEKMKLLLGILARENPASVIVFCNTKRMSEVIAKRLSINGYETEFIIGDLPQSKRLQVIDSFKRGSLRCLVATDVAARGIDVNDLAMVVNYDLPNESENYVHRIGRTARAGKTGKAYSFCSEQDVYNLPAIEKYLEFPIPSSVASEELLTEDKSSGVYIRTGNYGDEDDRGDRGRHARGGRGERGERSDRAPGGRGNGNRSGPGAGSGSGRTRDPSDRSRGRSDAPQGSRNSRRPSSRGAETPDRNRRDGDIGDLSALSFDERMAIYRKKYGNDAAPSEASAAVSGGGQRRKRGQKQGSPVSDTPKQGAQESARTGKNGSPSRNNSRGGAKKPSDTVVRDGNRQPSRSPQQSQSAKTSQTTRNAPRSGAGSSQNARRPSQQPRQPAASPAVAADKPKQSFMDKIKSFFSKKK